MVHNERGGRGVPRSLSLKIAPVSWGFKGAEQAERKTGWLCQNGREIWREIMRELRFFGARKFVRNLARKCWAYDLQHPKMSHKFPARFRTFFLGFSFLLTLVCFATDCSPSSWVGRKPHRELGRGAQQSYNMTCNETKRVCLRERCVKD